MAIDLHVFNPSSRCNPPTNQHKEIEIEMLRNLPSCNLYLEIKRDVFLRGNENQT